MEIEGGMIKGETGVLFATAECDGILCEGAACGDVSIEAVYQPGTQLLATFKVTNNNTRQQISFIFKWVNYIGGTGMRFEGKLTPGQSQSVNLQNYGIIGYYSSSVTFI